MKEGQFSQFQNILEHVSSKIDEFISSNHFDVENESIYDGLSGIILTLIEYYRVTNRQEYIEKSKICATKLIHYCYSNRSTNSNFFTGRLGTCYTLNCLSTVTNDEYYKNESISIGKATIQWDSPILKCDLLSGRAGVILGLTHYSSVCNEKWVFDLMDKSITSLIEGINIGIEGIYWDRYPLDILGLCGLSHGSSGVAFVLLELFSLTNNVAFKMLAAEAYKYEDFFYDQKTKNWPDLRKRAYSSESIEGLISKFDNKEYIRFTSIDYRSAWCHGGPGIFLSRIRANEIDNLTWSRDWMEKPMQSLKASIDQPAISHCLCHGDAGNGLILHEATKLDIDNHTVSIQYAERILESFQRNGNFDFGSDKKEDLSLFLGLSGIAYFLLKISSQPSDHILSPRIEYSSKLNESFKSFINEKSNKYYEAIVKKLYPFVWNEMKAGDTKIELAPLFENVLDINNLGKALREKLRHVSKNMDERFQIDEAWKILERSNYNHCFQWVSIASQSRQIKNLVKIENLVAKLSPYVKIISLEKMAGSNDSKIILFSSPGGLQILEISEDEKYLLERFENASRIGRVIHNIANDFDMENLEASILLEIKNYLELGVLLIEATNDDAN